VENTEVVGLRLAADGARVAGVVIGGAVCQPPPAANAFSMPSSSLMPAAAARGHRSGW